MATLAPSLRALFNEVDLNWPNRDRRTDGWIGDAAHRARTSDHNPDSRGIVHAIDIDRDGPDPIFIVEQCISENRPTEYVIFDRTIWSRTRDFVPRPYTGSNPHTDHIHVSIRYGTTYEADTWSWGIAPPMRAVGVAWRTGPGDEMGTWEGSIRAVGEDLVQTVNSMSGAIAVMQSLMR